MFNRSMTCLNVEPYRNNSSGAHLMTVTEVKKEREKEISFSSVQKRAKCHIQMIHIDANTSVGGRGAINPLR